MKTQIDRLGKVSITVDKHYWDITKDYDKLVIVEREGDTAYLSRKPVPAGTLIANREYWIKLGFAPESVIGISQLFGYDPTIAISQKAITERFDDIQRQIDAIIGKSIEITHSLSKQEITMGDENSIDITINTNLAVSKFRLIKEVPGEEPIVEEYDCSDNPVKSHTFTDVTTLSTYISHVQYAVVVWYNNKEYNYSFSIDVVKKNPNLKWSAATAEYILGKQNVLPTLSHDGSGYEIEYSTSNPAVAEFNQNNELVVKAEGTCNIVASTEGNDIYSDSTVGYGLTVTDKLESIVWIGKNITPTELTVGGTATLTRGTIEAVYSSGTVRDITNMNGIIKVTNGTFDDATNVFTATTRGTAVIKVRYNNVESTSNLTVNIESVPAYVGGGTTAEDACVPANAVSNYGGSTPVEYTAHADAGDYYYFIFPEGTTISGITSGPFGVPYENLGIQTINGYRYQVYRNYDMQAISVDDTFTVTFNY